MANVDSKTCLFRVVGFLVFVLIGGAIFMQIEKDKKHSTAKQYTFEDLQRHWIKKYNLSRENITTMLQDYENTRESEARQEWSFLNSVYFVLQLLTTIGYGNITPQTPSGQLFTIAYAMVGIPLTLLALKSIGKLLNVALRTTIRPLHRTFHAVHCEERSCDFLETGNVFINVMCLSLTWILVAALSTYLELKRGLISNIYSIFITYSTVGFGDIIPFEDHKYVFMIIVIPGLCSMSGLIDSIVAYLERTNMATRRCFSFSNCWPAKRKARITANGTQQDTASDNETPYEGERVSSDKAQNKVVMATVSDKSVQTQMTQWTKQSQ